MDEQPLPETNPVIPDASFPPSFVPRRKRTISDKLSFKPNRDTSAGKTFSDGRKILNYLPATESIETSIKKATYRRPETEHVDMAYKESQALLIETMNKIGLDAFSMAHKLKSAIELCFKTGKYAYGGGDGRTLVEVPDLKALKDLMFLWGSWMRVGRPSGTNIGNAHFNLFGNTGLDEASRQRVVGVIELLETEVKRRGFPDVCQGDSKAQDATPLPGVVEPSPGEEEVVDRGSPG